MSDCKTCNGRGKVQHGYGGEELIDCPECVTSKKQPRNWEKLAKERGEEIVALSQTVEDKRRLIDSLASKLLSMERKNCEECGWPNDACCCEPPPKTVKPYCGECGGEHEPSGARSDCVLYWKRRAVVAENLVNVLKHYGVEGIKPL